MPAMLASMRMHADRPLLMNRFQRFILLRNDKGSGVEEGT
jgi:hypothetical protein